MKPTLIDRAVAVFSPRTAALRLRWRAQMSAMAHFDAAGSSRRMQGTRAPAGDADEAVRDAGIVRNRARDMVRNNALAKRAVSALVNNIVGDGIIPSVRASSAKVQKQVQDVLLEHLDTTAIDAMGRSNFYGLQRLAVAAMIESGEALIRRRSRFLSDPLPLPMQVEVLEPEFLDGSVVGLQANGQTVADGIEFDALGRRTGYRLYRENPYGRLVRDRSTVTVPAEAIIHLYRQDRPGQNRGMSWLAPVLGMMTDAYDYADAQLLRQKIAAMWVGFTRDIEADGADIKAVKDGTSLATELQPGMFEHLPPGRDVTFASPPPTEGYSEHMAAVQRMIASALDLTYESLSGDLSGVNFSSGRMGRMEMRRALSAVQWLVVIPVLCQPFERWLKQAVQEKLGIAPGRYSIHWTPPRFEMVDPPREIPAAVAAIRGGLTSRQRTIREFGFDPEEINREIEADRDWALQTGISFDGDVEQIAGIDAAGAEEI